MWTSERLIVRPWRPQDAAAWLELSRNEGFNRFIVRPYRMENLSEALAFVDKWRRFHDRTGLGLFPVFLKSTSEMIGVTAVKTLKVDDEPKEAPELMYRFSDRHWGKGYAAEASGLLLDLAFGSKRVERVIAVADEANLPSLRVLGKLGFRYLRPTSFLGHPLLLHERLSSCAPAWTFIDNPDTVAP